MSYSFLSGTHRSAIPILKEIALNNTSSERYERAGLKGLSPPSIISDWSKTKGKKLVAECMSIFSVPLLNLDVLGKFPEAWRGEIGRFLLSLESYNKFVKIPEAPKASEIFRYSLLLGPKFPEVLKKLKLECLWLTLETGSLGEYEPQNIFRPYKVGDISEVFNAAYLPNFLEEVDDREYYKIPVSLDKTDEWIFKNKLSSLLPDQIEIVDGREILLEVTGSSCGVKPTKIWKEKEKKSKNCFSSDPLNARRCVIPVKPGGYRDAVVFDLPTVNTVKWIDKQTLKVVENMPYNGMISDPRELKRTLDHFYEKYQFFLMRDIKKDGITKPRPLLIWALQVLKEKYREAEAFQYLDIYRELTLDGEYVPRGTGLGMANSLTTLIQITLFSLILDRICEEEPETVGKIGCLTYNDDFVVATEKEDLLESYWNYEDEILKQFNIIRNDKKSFRAKKAFVFLEEYYPPSLNRKRVYYDREVRLCYACQNIAEAKYQFASLRLNEELTELLLPEVISYWGYEFFPEEKSLPLDYGGWIPYNHCGISYSLYAMLEQNDWDPKFHQVWESCRNNTPKFRSKLKGFYWGPVSYIFNMNKECSELLCGVRRSLVDSRYSSAFSNPEERKYFWKSVLNSRKRKFESLRDCDIDLNDHLRVALRSCKNLLIPPRIAWKKRFGLPDFKGHLLDPYNQTNKILARVLFELRETNRFTLPDGLSDYDFFTRENSIDRLIDLDYERIYYEKRVGLEDTILYFEPKEEYNDIFSFVPKPFHYVYVAKWLGLVEVPVIDKGLYQLKTSDFREIVSQEDWKKIQALDFIIEPGLVLKYLEVADIFDEMWDEIDRRVKETIQPSTESEISSYDEIDISIWQESNPYQEEPLRSIWYSAKSYFEMRSFRSSFIDTQRGPIRATPEIIMIYRRSGIRFHISEENIVFDSGSSESDTEQGLDSFFSI